MPASITRYLLDDERWLRLLSPTSRSSRRGLFLDRDGVILEERGYLKHPDEVALIHGCRALIQHARSSDMVVVVVTNQSGIGRGYATWHDYFRVENKMLQLLAREGVTVDAVLANAATPHPNAQLHNWRKPNPGMFTTAAAVLNVDLRRSIVIGDKAGDLLAGRAAGLSMGVHVLTGHGLSEVDAAQSVAAIDFKVMICSSIEAVVAPLSAAFRDTDNRCFIVPQGRRSDAAP